MVPRFEKRVKAYAADISGLALAFLLASFGFSNIYVKVGIIVGAYLLLIIIPLVISKGQTFGKRVQKIKIVNNDGSDTNIIILIVREIFKTIVSIITFGLYSVVAAFLTTEKKASRTIHDYLFNTKVIDLTPYNPNDKETFLQKGESMKRKGL